MNTLATTGPQALPALAESARTLAAASLSSNTKRAYGSALARLDGWLAGRPLDDAALAAYLASIHDAGRSPAVASQAVAAVKLRAKLSGQPSPAGPATDAVLRGLRREGKARGRGQVAGIKWAQADAAAAVAGNGGGSARGLRDAAILAVASDAMLRVSEVAALDVDDVQREADGSGRLMIRSSKTDQEGEGAIQYLGPATMRRVRSWMVHAGIAAGPLFRSVNRGGNVQPGRLSDRSIRTIIQARAADAGIEGRVSGHSLRVGSAQSLASAGASVVDMQTAGRWKSPSMPGRYARGELAGRGAVARLRYGAGS